MHSKAKTKKHKRKGRRRTPNIFKRAGRLGLFTLGALASQFKPGGAAYPNLPPPSHLSNQRALTSSKMPGYSQTHNLPFVDLQTIIDQADEAPSLIEEGGQEGADTSAQTATSAAGSTKSSAAQQAQTVKHVDIGGEGIVDLGHQDGSVSGFADSENVNVLTHQSSRSGGPIPNRVPLESWNDDLPYGDGTVERVTFQNTPLSDHMVREAARIVTPGGRIDLWVDPEYANQVSELASLTGGEITSPTSTPGQFEQLISIVNIGGVGAAGSRRGALRGGRRRTRRRRTRGKRTRRKRRRQRRLRKTRRKRK